MCDCVCTCVHVCGSVCTCIHVLNIQVWDYMCDCVCTCVMFVIVGVYQPWYMCGGSGTTLGAGPPPTPPGLSLVCTQASWPASFRDFPVSASFPSPCRNAGFIDARLNLLCAEGLM